MSGNRAPETTLWPQPLGYNAQADQGDARGPWSGDHGAGLPRGGSGGFPRQNTSGSRKPLGPLEPPS